MTVIPIFLQKDFDLTNYSSFHTKARAKYFFDIHTKEDIEHLSAIYQFSEEHDFPIVFIGGGSNTLFAFDLFEGIIVRSHLTGYEIEGNTLTVSSGELVSPVALKLEREYGNPVFLPWIGLPGTFGGAVVGNAGCFDLEAADIVQSVDVYDMEKWIFETYQKTELGYRYRHSNLKGRRNIFVISASLNIQRPIDTPTDARLFRKDKQPGWWSCGSFFANPEGNSAGRLIDEAGLKGTKVGGIKISERHGNFFINDGTATYQDVLSLRDKTKIAVLEKFGIELHEEVRIIEHSPSL